jgi:peroxiredoxin Q/BCP
MHGLLKVCVAGLLLVVTAVAAVNCAARQRPDGGSGLLPAGRSVPPLSAVDHRGQTVDLRQLANEQHLLVYFYPKDGTPGCTKEACAIRDVWQKFEAVHVFVVGVSSDSLESHRQFASEHQLQFPLVSDADGRWADAFGVSQFLGMHERVSFLFARGGRLRHVYPDVDPAVHADEVLAHVAAM